MATGMGIHEVLTAPRSPWQNAYAERLIGSIRRECLDHVIVANELGLSRIRSEGRWEQAVDSLRLRPVGGLMPAARGARGRAAVAPFG